MTESAELQELREGSGIAKVSADYHFYGNCRVYECKVLLVPEESGGFSAHALRLPGVVSQGDTEDEALKNIAEAFEGAIKTYLDAGEIPWTDTPIEREKGCLERWIIVDVS